jgi:DNA-binding LacI/PurR family transcriptional regulator
LANVKVVQAVINAAGGNRAFICHMNKTRGGGATRKPTIATVAAKARVAVSTVSRYMNRHNVSKSVRERLSDVIETLGYSRSWTARNLSLGRRGSIGVAVDWSHDPWFVQLLTGIEEELASHSTGLMLCSLELRGPQILT